MRSIRIWHSLLSWYLVSIPTMWYFKMHSAPDNLALSALIMFCAINMLFFYTGLANLLNSEKLVGKAADVLQIVTFPLVFIPLMFGLLYLQDSLMDTLISLSGSSVIHDSGLRFNSWRPGF